MVVWDHDDDTQIVDYFSVRLIDAAIRAIIGDTDDDVRIIDNFVGVPLTDVPRWCSGCR